MINYYLLTKPGIIFGNLVTMAAGFLLATRGVFHFWLFFTVLLGLGLIIASACVFNNYIDRETDKKMKRTETRILARGGMNATHAILFAIILAAVGNVILLFNTNWLTVILANIGFGIYVILYSLWKSRTVYGTAIGSFAGAIPPVVGYCSMSNRFDIGAAILFMMLVLWQMPHFFAIAISHLHDYKAAGLPLLPIEKGVFRTKIHMTFYILGFIFMITMLTFFHFTGYAYLFAAVGISLFWLVLCIRGFIASNDQIWAKDMFRFSLVVIMTISCMLFLDVYK
jgi:protoheme IX farnesyltransferase